MSKASKARVLIVDDSRTSRRVLRNILETGGFEVSGEACDGEQAIDLYDAQRPDLVTLDITMPVLDGIETLKRLKGLDPGAKVVMVSSAGQVPKVMECFKFGASEFLSKPYEADKIVSVLQKVAAKK